MAGVKRRVYEILEVAAPGDHVSRTCDIFLVSLICANILALILGSIKSVRDASPNAFMAFEAVSVGIFTLEYALRVWSYTEEPRYSRPVSGRIKFIFSPIQLLDLLAIVPFFLVFLGLDLRALRAVRLLARAARLSRYFTGLRTLGGVLQAKRYELFTVMLVLVVLLILASSLMFFAEHTVQPGGVLQHTRGHVVDHRHLDHCGLRRCLPHYVGGEDSGRVYRHLGYRVLRPASGDPGVPGSWRKYSDGRKVPGSAPTAVWKSAIIRLLDDLYRP